MLKVKFIFSGKIKTQGKESLNYLSLNCLSKTIKKNLYLLYMNDEVFTGIFSKIDDIFQKCKEMQQLFSKAKIYPTERLIGLFKCSKKRWKVYENEKKHENFTSSITQNAFKTNHRLNCDDKCLIYLLACKKCFKQYVGVTQKYFVKDGTTTKIMPESFSEKKVVRSNIFQSPGHTGFMEGFCLTFIDEANSFIPTMSKDY